MRESEFITVEYTSGIPITVYIHIQPQSTPPKRSRIDVPGVTIDWNENNELTGIEFILFGGVNGSRMTLNRIMSILERYGIDLCEQEISLVANLTGNA